MGDLSTLFFVSFLCLQISWATIKLVVTVGNEKISMTVLEFSLSALRDNGYDPKTCNSNRNRLTNPV